MGTSVRVRGRTFGWLHSKPSPVAACQVHGPLGGALQGEPLDSRVGWWYSLNLSVVRVKPLPFGCGWNKIASENFKFTSSTGTLVTLEYKMTPCGPAFCTYPTLQRGLYCQTSDRAGTKNGGRGHRAEITETKGGPRIAPSSQL
eukprot:659470-Hanusia_phi.AAC.1